MARRKKRGHEGHENAERWLLTYADMITLLMAFFIMMYSMSVLNLNKFNAVAFSIRSGFGGVLKGGKHLLMHEEGPRPSSLRSPIVEPQNLNTVKQRMKSYTVMENLESEVEVHGEMRGLVVSIAAEGLLFEAGSATLSGRARGVLDKVVELLRPLPNPIAVEGHTCTLPIRTTAFPTNWELSAARACSVVRFLENSGVASKRLTATGFGPSRPRASNETAEGRRHNRRVDIIILHEFSTSALQGSPGVGEQAGTRHSIRPSIPKVWQHTSPQGGEQQ